MDTIKINQHEGLRHQLRWQANGQPFDITGMAIDIVDAHPRALMEGTVEIQPADEDPATWGIAHMLIPGSLFAKALLGRSAWIRLGLRLSDGELDTTPPIWIEIV